MTLMEIDCPFCGGTNLVREYAPSHDDPGWVSMTECEKCGEPLDFTDFTYCEPDPDADHDRDR